MSFYPRLLRAAFCANLSLAALLLAGCSDDGTVTVSPAAAMVKGNWQINAAASPGNAAAAKLPVLSGEFTSEAGTISGILHSQSPSACVGPAASFAVTGSADAKSVVSLTGPVAGGTLTLTGTLAADGKSLTDSSYNVVGGSCALAQKVQATAQAFTPITGSYTGHFADADGNIAQVTAIFSQSPSSDPNGNFTLSGSATITNNNPCFPSALTLTNTQVTGGTFTYTLAPSGSSNGNRVTATGTFNSDAATLTTLSWTSSGSCGADTGVQSTMTRQGS